MLEAAMDPKLKVDLNVVDNDVWPCDISYTTS
jgi:hypothetical protein